MEETKKSPIWKQAVEDFLASDFTYGSIVPHQWFVDHFELERPQTAHEQRVFQGAMANNFKRFQRHMLSRHCMDFVNSWGTGYLVVKPDHQTAEALKDTRDTIRKAIAEGMNRVVFVRQDMLTDSQRQENTDAINKLSGLKSISSPKKWLS